MISGIRQMGTEVKGTDVRSFYIPTQHFWFPVVEMTLVFCGQGTRRNGLDSSKSILQLPFGRAFIIMPKA